MILKYLEGKNAMKKILLTTLLFAMIVTLSSCGGGGGGATGGNPGTGSSALILTITPVDSSLPANTVGYPAFIGSPFLTQVQVRVTFENGQEVATGTIVHLQTNNAGIAFVSAPDDPDTSDINEFTSSFTGLDQETVGAIATYFIRSGSQTGAAVFTANATHPTTSRNHSKNLSFNITAGPGSSVKQLDVLLPRTSLPVNNQNTDFFLGTPFMMEGDIQFKDVFGNITNPAVGDDGNSIVNVSINPATVLYFTTLDDPLTPNINEFISPDLAQGSIEMNSGHGNLFLWSRSIPGTATVTLTAIEAGSGFEISTSFNIDVVDDGSNPGQPSTVTLTNNGEALYVNGSGGSTSQNLNITVSSGSLPVLDPQVNNVKLTLVTVGANSGEKLTGTNISGSSVQGTSVNIGTVNGIANILVNSGTNPNTIIVTATVDRSDNNVDNGIQDGISSTRSYIVSDGVLWSLELVSPALDSLTVNVETEEDGSIDFQDGTYSLIVSAIATDKSGNPALPQTLQFGMINSPISGYPNSGPGSFVLSGVDGNPQEGGSIFTSTSGSFLTAGGGVQNGDTLLVFGEESLGNEDLESAVSVASVNSQTSLSIIEKFNRNDGTGTINNDFGILPYVIGRAVDGNITATAVINEKGVATTRLNYPVSQLGRVTALFVKGQGAVVNSVVRTVTDVEVTAFPGVEGFNGQSSTLVVSPNIIPGNVNNIGFVVCVADSARNPLAGRAISFSYVGGNGQGIIDGQSGSGVMTQRTGTNGCASGVVTTNGLIPGAGTGDTGFNFFAGNITCDVANSSGSTCMEVVPPSNAVLNATPSSFLGRGSVGITLTLFDGGGQPISSAAISGTCTQVAGGSLSIIGGPSVTNSLGQSVVTVGVSLDGVGGGLNGSCTFATASGNPSVTVNFSGGDSCTLGLPSPTPPSGACSALDYSVSGTISGIVGVSAISLQNNGIDTLNLNGNVGFTFPLQSDGTAYNITVSSQPVGQLCTVTNASGSISGAHVTNVIVTCI